MDDIEYGLDTRLHVYRRYNAKPFRRFALTVERAHTPDGYEILDHDPRVADTAFLNKFHAQMIAPVERVRTGYIENGLAITETLDVAQPGQYSHYGTAIRRMPGTTLMAKGRNR